MPFWIVETPRSIIDPTRHKHVIFGLNQPTGGIYVAGPYPTEGSAVDALNEIVRSELNAE